MRKLTVLLGAGFSINAGYPTGKDLNFILENDIEFKALKQKSGEWLYNEYGNKESIKNLITVDNIKIPFLLSSLINRFKKKSEVEFNYESFYDWLAEIYKDFRILKEEVKKVNERMNDEFSQTIESKFLIQEKEINRNLYNKISDCFIYLICDVLSREYQRELKINEYEPFFKYIEHFDSVDVFTLNHDCLFEYLTKHYSVKYTDGFTINDSFIIGAENEPQAVFVDKYESETIKLYKLHGSIDYYLFELYDVNGINYNKTDKYFFYKPKSFHDKHFSKLIDLETKNTIQRANWNITPQFLSGRNIKKRFLGQHFYSNLFEHFKNSISDCNQLLVIGYSYFDDHVNDIISESTKNFNFNVLNINPSKKFQFEVNAPSTVKNIDYLSRIT